MQLTYFQNVITMGQFWNNDLLIFAFLFIYFLPPSPPTDAQQFQCPKNRGQFEDSIQCDKYYVCDEGVATEKYCPDGLVFDQTIKLVNKCDQPFNVDCGDRLELRKYSLSVLFFVTIMFCLCNPWPLGQTFSGSVKAL